jgi:hypothetical protein
MRRRFEGWALAAIAAATLGGCGGEAFTLAEGVDGEDDAGAAAPTDAGAPTNADATSPADAGPLWDADAAAPIVDASDSGAGRADAAAADAAHDAACVPVVSAPIAAVEDALLVTGSTQSFGTTTVCNSNVGRCIFRFALPAALATALSQGKAAQAALTIQRVLSDPACDRSTCTGPGYDTATLATASPLRSDWSEAGVTWFSMGTGAAWGAPGATKVGIDEGTPAGSAKLVQADLRVTVPLDPVALAPWVQKTSLSVVVDFDAAFVASMHEKSPAVPPATLVVSSCP